MQGHLYGGYTPIRDSVLVEFYLLVLIDEDKEGVGSSSRTGNVSGGVVANPGILKLSRQRAVIVTEGGPGFQLVAKTVYSPAVVIAKDQVTRDPPDIESGGSEEHGGV